MTKIKRTKQNKQTIKIILSMVKENVILMYGIIDYDVC